MPSVCQETVRIRLVAAAMLMLVLAWPAGTLAQQEAPPDGRVKADILAAFGAPEAFAVYYFDEVTVDGEVEAVAFERWTYYSEGVELSFAGDAVVSEIPVRRIAAEDVRAAPYDPDSFSPYMSLDEVLAAAGIEEYLGGPVEALVEDGELYFADQLSWGMKGDELRYVEAFAAEPATETRGDR